MKTKPLTFYLQENTLGPNYSILFPNKAALADATLALGGGTTTQFNHYNITLSHDVSLASTGQVFLVGEGSDSSVASWLDVL